MKYFMCVLVLLGVSAQASTIEVDGNLWLQPADFAGLSYDEIGRVCDETSGFCSGNLAGFDLTGWTWASPDDLNGLFNHYIGSDELGPGQDTHFAASSTAILDHPFFDDFLPTAVNLPRSANTLGFMAGVSHTVGGFNTLENFGAIIAVYETGRFNLGVTSSAGGWFKKTSIPLPGTVHLFGVSLVLVGLARSRKQKRFGGFELGRYRQ